MQPLNVVIAQGDFVAAEALASSLHGYFRNVAVARNAEELRKVILRQPADAAVVDLELVSFHELENLCLQFAEIPVVATHRIPDDSMWNSALSAGAIDCCDSNDVRNIIGAIERTAIKPRHFRIARAA